MSNTATVYVGPFIRVKLQPIEDTEMAETCPNLKCSNHKQNVETPYCSQCGCMVRQMEVGVSYTLDCDELLYNNNLQFNNFFDFDLADINEVTQLNQQLLVPSQREHYIVKSVEPTDTSLDPTVTSLDPVVVDSVYSNFLEHIQEPLQLLKDSFGEENIEVNKIGVINYIA